MIEKARLTDGEVMDAWRRSTPDACRAIADAATDKCWPIAYAQGQKDLAKEVDRQISLTGVFGHDHWDSTMQGGAGCRRCQAQRDFRAWLRQKGLL